MDDEPIVNNYLMLNLRAALDTSALVSISHEANWFWVLLQNFILTCTFLKKNKLKKGKICNNKKKTNYSQYNTKHENVKT